MKVNVERESASDPGMLVIMPMKKRSPLKGKAFVKMMPCDFAFMMKRLTMEEFHLFCWLATKVQWQTNMVVDEHEQSLSIVEVVKRYERGVGERQVIRLINRLVEEKIVYRGKTGRCTQLFINPSVVYFGETPDETLLSMFGLDKEQYIKKSDDKRKRSKA